MFDLVEVKARSITRMEIDIPIPLPRWSGGNNPARDPDVIHVDDATFPLFVRLAIGWLSHEKVRPHHSEAGAMSQAEVLILQRVVESDDIYVDSTQRSKDLKCERRVDSEGRRKISTIWDGSVYPAGR